MFIAIAVLAIAVLSSAVLRAIGLDGYGDRPGPASEYPFGPVDGLSASPLR